MGGCIVCSSNVVEKPIPKQTRPCKATACTNKGGTMRIKQRARAIIGKPEWVYGTVVDLEIMNSPIGNPSTTVYGTFLNRNGFADWNMPRPMESIKVDPDTVGLFACTVNNIDFYEGDIIQNAMGNKGVIRYGDFKEISGQDFIGFFIDWYDDNDTLIKSAAYWLKSQKVSIIGTEK